MKEKPIIFSGPMVQAILNGTKTQTRRVVNPQPKLRAPVNIESWQAGITAFKSGQFGVYREGKPIGRWGLESILKCPYGQPGDQLYVREAFQIESNYGIDSEENYPPPFNDGRPIHRVSDEEDWDFGPYWEQCHYRATDDKPMLEYEDGLPWKPSIFMPKWASRIKLLIKDVRVQRLENISNEDISAEGIK
jgi:hypothetical protein